MFKKLKNSRLQRKLSPKKSIASIIDSHHKQKKTPPLFQTATQAKAQNLKDKKGNTKLLQIKDSIKKMEKTKKALQFCFSFAIMIGVFYFLFISSIFQITTINIYQVVSEPDPEDNSLTIQRLEPFENDQLRNLLNRSILRNLILLNTDSLKVTLNQTILNLEELEIKKEFPKTLTIQFKQFDRVANLINLVGPGKIQKNLLIDENGKAVNIGETRPDLPTIRVQTDEPFEKNKTAIKVDYLNYILQTKQYFEENFDLQVVDLTYLPKAREVHIYTNNNLTLWLDIQEDYEQQLDKLKLALPNLNIYDGTIDYVDLRIKNLSGEKIIYKLK